MRRLTYLVPLSAIALLMLVPPTAGAQSQDVVAVPIQDTVTVSIQDFFFDPAQISVAPGTTVQWVNEGAAPHTVTADDGSFDSETLNPGDSFMVTFSGSGTLTYHCEIHPSMTGSVTVSENGGGGVAPEKPADGTMDMSGSMDMAGG